MGVLLAVALVSTAVSVAPAPRPLNAEPLAVGAVGLAGIGVGIWRLFVAESASADLTALGVRVERLTPAQRAQSSRELLAEGQAARQRGAVDTALGGSLLALGGLLLAGSVAWLVVEGVTRPAVVVLPAAMPGSGAVVLQGRF